MINDIAYKKSDPDMKLIPAKIISIERQTKNNRKKMESSEKAKEPAETKELLIEPVFKPKKHEFL